MAKQHTVAQGECLSSIAAKYGFRDYRLIYDHPTNKAFRQKRPNPNVIHPGDVITIPEKPVKTVRGATGRSHVFSVPAPKRILRLRILDAEGKPVANEPVEFAPEGKPAVQARRTDAQGEFEIAVEPDARGATLKIGGYKLPLRFSHLNPIRETPDEGISGIQARLANLGYYTGPSADQLDRATRIALSLFQYDAGLERDGKPNAATLDKLMEAYGC
jgi:hypothetical protein